MEAVPLVYRKRLAHDIDCLLLSQCELGVEPTIWDDGPRDEAPSVLPLVRPG
jgi:hypothetical protein